MPKPFNTESYSKRYPTGFKLWQMIAILLLCSAAFLIPNMVTIWRHRYATMNGELIVGHVVRSERRQTRGSSPDYRWTEI